MDAATETPARPLTPRLWSVTAAADQLDVTPRYVWSLIASGVLSRVRMGGRTLVRDDELAELIESSTEPRRTSDD